HLRGLRLFQWWGNTPPNRAKNKIGIVEANPIRPSQKAEFVRWSTSQPWATFCIQVPMLDRKLPAQNQRKSRWRNARTISGNSTADVSVASASAPASPLAAGGA